MKYIFVSNEGIYLIVRYKDDFEKILYPNSATIMDPSE